MKEEHADSLRVLRMQALVMFTLETKWMPSLCRGHQGDEVDDDDSGNEGDRAGETGHCSGWTMATMVIARTKNLPMLWRATN